MGLKDFLAFSLLVGTALSNLVAVPVWPAEKLRVIVPEFGMNQIPIYVAKERGFFKEWGIEAEVIKAPAHIGIHALIAGETDFLAAGGIPIRARLHGAPVKVVGVMQTRSLYWLYAKPDVRSVSALRNATIGVPVVGSIIDAMTNIVLEKYDLKPNDVIYRSLGGSLLRLQALRQGLIDATVLAAPYNFEAKKSGFVQLSFFAEEVPLTGSHVSTADKIIKERPEVLRRFMLGVIKGNLFVKTERLGTIALVRRWTGIEEELARDTYEAAAPSFSQTGIQSRPSMAADVEIQRRAFKIEANLPLEQIFDFSWAKAADALR